MLPNILVYQLKMCSSFLKYQVSLFYHSLYIYLCHSAFTFYRGRHVCTYLDGSNIVMIYCGIIILIINIHFFCAILLTSQRNPWECSYYLGRAYLFINAQWVVVSGWLWYYLDPIMEFVLISSLLSWKYDNPARVRVKHVPICWRSQI